MVQELKVGDQVRCRFGQAGTIIQLLEKAAIVQVTVEKGASVMSAPLDLLTRVDKGEPQSVQLGIVQPPA